MRRLPGLLAFVLHLAALGITPVVAQTSAPPMPREQIEQIVREYLLRNPEVILEAIENLEEKRRREAEGTQRAAIAAKREELYEDPTAPVAGNPTGDVTLVEFFDYRCPYCKQVMPALAQLLKEDTKLRFVFKELPILGPDSVVAARAALAAHRQGKYLPLHDALMRTRGTLDEATVMKIASGLGLDVARLKADMASPETDEIISRNRRLARELAISGTPAFVVGERIVPGAVDLDTLKKLIAEARQP